RPKTNSPGPKRRQWPRGLPCKTFKWTSMRNPFPGTRDGPEPHFCNFTSAFQQWEENNQNDNIDREVGQLPCDRARRIGNSPQPRRLRTRLVKGGEALGCRPYAVISSPSRWKRSPRKS